MQRREASVGAAPAFGGGLPVHDVLLRIEDRRERGGIEMVALFYCRPLSGVFYRPRGIRLLPVDSEWIRGLKATPWKSRTLPDYTMNTERLYYSLMREYLFVSLYRAFAEPLAGENAARLASMQFAERNIEDRLCEQSSEFRPSRQSAVTSELLDIVAAFETLKGAARYQAISR